MCRRLGRSQPGNCVVAPWRPVALVKPSWNSMPQTQSFDETLSLTSALCKSPSVSSTASSSASLGRRLRINVCGLHFETFVALLDRHPSTLLGDHQQRLRFYDAARDELFLDRHRPTFEAVFAYLQSRGPNVETVLAHCQAVKPLRPSCLPLVQTA